MGGSTLSAIVHGLLLPPARTAVVKVKGQKATAKAAMRRQLPEHMLDAEYVQMLRIGAFARVLNVHVLTPEVLMLECEHWQLQLQSPRLP